MASAADFEPLQEFEAEDGDDGITFDGGLDLPQATGDMTIYSQQRTFFVVVWHVCNIRSRQKYVCSLADIAKSKPPGLQAHFGCA